MEIKEDRALYWLSQGAQPTKAVNGLLTGLGTIDRLARWKGGEALDKLLEEAAAARQPAIEETAPSRKKAKAQPVTAESAAVEAGIESQEVTIANTEMSDTEGVNQKATERAEEEA